MSPCLSGIKPKCDVDFSAVVFIIEFVSQTLDIPPGTSASRTDSDQAPLAFSLRWSKLRLR